MKPVKSGYIYIVTNKTRKVLYTGVTSQLLNRIHRHRIGKGCIFTKRYNAKYLIYFEQYNSIYRAIEREKQLKNWKRKWKLDLIKKANPELRDLWPDLIGEFRSNE